MKDTGTVLTLLKQRIRGLVSARITDASCRTALLKLLGQRGYALHESGPCRAGVLSIEAYRVVRGKLDEIAWTAAAAVEMQMEAAYALDDVVDSEGGAGAAEAVSVSLASLALGYSLACEAARDAGPGGSRFAPLLDYHRNLNLACSGFFLDAHLKSRESLTLGDALDMTQRKSGALGRLAAAFGAGVAAGNPDLIANLGDLGESLFTYQQLVDDLRDACTLRDGTTDLIQNKKTLPLVYFRNYLHDRDGAIGDGTIDWQGMDVQAEYEKSGAPIYGAIVAETFLNRAKQTLEALRTENLAVRNLESLVATIEAGSCDAVPA